MKIEREKKRDAVKEKKRKKKKKRGESGAIKGRSERPSSPLLPYYLKVINTHL